MFVLLTHSVGIPSDTDSASLLCSDQGAPFNMFGRALILLIYADISVTFLTKYLVCGTKSII